MPMNVKFSVSTPGGDRIHYVNEQDVRVLLGRLPHTLWSRLRAVHFDDQGFRFRRRTFGYVTNEGRREITLCALPPRIGLTKIVLQFGQTPEQFGARRGHKWPVLAVRRFLLYNVFLHELGHLQLINKRAPSARRKFADERLAEAFAIEWCDRLWSESFVHADPVHNPPSLSETAALAAETKLVRCE
jgi:hypothetical protein